MADYKHVSIPTALWTRLARLVADHPELGYRSVSEAASEAVRRLCQEIEDRTRSRGGG